MLKQLIARVGLRALAGRSSASLRPLPVAIGPPVPNLLIIKRDYAKSKDRGGDKKTRKSAKVHINENQLSTVLDVEAMRAEMQASVDKLKDEYARHISLRTAAGSIEQIKVVFEEQERELQELAQVVRKNPKTIVVNMAAFPQAIPHALDALRSAGLGVNPQQEGTTLYVPVPKVTKEHRELLAKNAKVLYVKCRDAIKNVTLVAFKDLKRREGLSEDFAAEVRKQVGALGEEYLERARVINQAKHDELLKTG